MPALFVKLMISVFAIVLGATMVAPTSYGAEKSGTLTFGVVPQQSASKLARLWTPILSEVSKQSGIQLQFRTAKDIPTFEKELSAGTYDLSYMNPYHYAVFSHRPGYSAFAKQQNMRIVGVIVVRKDSKIQNLSELDGQTLAFPSPAAFAATLLPQAHLRKLGITYEASYVSSHDSVYRNVASGRAVAGGGIIRTLNNIDPEVRDQLRVLWESIGYTPHAFAAHPSVNTETLERVATAIVMLEESKLGKELLAAINFKGIERASSGEWDDVRELDFNTLDQYLKEN